MNLNIRVRYKFPDHPEADLLKDLCERYKVQSAELQKKHEEAQKEVLIEKRRERRLDLEFENRLRSIDLQEETPSADEKSSKSQKKK